MIFKSVLVPIFSFNLCIKNFILTKSITIVTTLSLLTPKSHSNSPQPVHFNRLRLHNTVGDSVIQYIWNI